MLASLHILDNALEQASDELVDFFGGNHEKDTFM